MSSISVLEKVYLLRQLNLPFDIVEEINNFVFYNYECANNRVIMRNILNVIKKPIMDGFDPNTGHWYFWADEHENQFQGSNCLKCGNYYNSNNLSVASDKVICHCF